jgi:hypothetical protein
MKLLFISANFPYPPRTGNTILSYNHIKHLSSRHQIDLLSLRDQDQVDAGELKNWCNHISTIVKTSGRRLKFQKMVGKLMGLPSQKSIYASESMGKWVKDQIANNSYDAVIFLQTETIQFKPANYAGPCILNMEDPLVLKFERSLPRYGRAMQARIRYETALLKRYEGKHIHEFDRVLLLNADDASDYKQLFPQGKFDWVPYGIDTNVFQPTPHIKREDNSIIISGSMYHPPNVEGVLFFCHEVLPRVHQQIPAAQLWVVGANPTDEVKRLAQQEGITVTGSVPDVRDYLCRARVSICPVKLKVGTQTKVLEAMACGTPVVTTSAGNNGIGATSGQHLWVADEPEHIAAQVVSLLRHKNWDAFSKTGREFVVQHFAWEHSAARLEEIIQQILIERAKR